ncbi:hypothetical protein [Anaerobaca lacustris]|uniref:Uncharacterized protein n=1 Tax=Anaerobaca lacustris TaxID=3044600 RepID=A0AAW6TTZ8_9BACT|nr:hypothetical protein [Sedimentisphaerales bacterium M17dextr]
MELEMGCPMPIWSSPATVMDPLPEQAHALGIALCQMGEELLE